MPAFDQLIEVLDMVTAMVSQVKVNEHILDDSRYDLMFSVEKVNQMAKDGVPFRDAYKQVGLAIERGEFVSEKAVNHTHEGSIGNLCNDKIAALYEQTLAQFGFHEYHNAFDALLGRV